MKYYLIAGEASGDLHASNLVKEMKALDADANLRGWGGDLMQDAGVDIVKHYRDLAFMGFTEVIMNLPTIIRNLSFCKKDILAFEPDVLVLIDYPGFNMRIAKWAHENKMKVIWYISPQIWAWKEKRVHAIKKYVHRMIVILPFEEAFYKKHEYKVDYVGHPLANVINEFIAAHKDVKKENIIALLPGSRKQEINVKLPIMLQAVSHFPDYKFIVAKAPGLPDSFYQQLLSAYPNAGSVSGETYLLLLRSKAALVTSGTATLETALFGVPQVICYKGGKISYEIAKRLIKIKFIGLVNLIMNKEVVKELIQDELTVGNLEHELKLLLGETDKLRQIKKDYSELQSLLNAGGNASAQTAAIITNAAMQKLAPPDQFHNNDHNGNKK